MHNLVESVESTEANYDGASSKTLDDPSLPLELSNALELNRNCTAGPCVVRQWGGAAPPCSAPEVLLLLGHRCE